MTSLNQPVAIVTGGSRGFGFELARSLLEAGWAVVTDGRNREDLSDAVESLTTVSSGRIVGLSGDVADEDHVSDLVARAAALGDVRLLVNNASVLGPSPQPRLGDYPVDVLESVFRVNVAAPVRLIQKTLPQLRATNGIVVNVTSDAAVEAYETWGGYGSSKAALEQISNVLATEESDVTVYWFDPGDMNTRMHQEAFPGEDISDRAHPSERVPALMALIESGLPSGRYTAEHVLQKVGT